VPIDLIENVGGDKPDYPGDFLGVEVPTPVIVDAKMGRHPDDDVGCETHQNFPGEVTHRSQRLLLGDGPVDFGMNNPGGCFNSLLPILTP
jgi:hypothetical protein